MRAQHINIQLSPSNTQAHSLTPRTTTARFTIVSRAEPGALPRILGFYAQNNFVPTQLKSRVFKGGDLVVDITMPDLSDQRVSIIAEKLRQLVDVRKVVVEQEFTTQAQVV